MKPLTGKHETLLKRENAKPELHRGGWRTLGPPWGQSRVVNDHR